MNGRRVACHALAASLFCLAPGAPAAGPYTYVGSETCKQCHFEIWADFRTTGHPFTLRSDASTRPLPLPGGHDWPDIGWVVGGRKWKANYLDTDGFVITKVHPGGPAEADGSNQYNLATDEWVDFHAGEEKPYDCGRCHTTGYAPGAVNPKPGIVGTWALEGVQCEACHGPASQHVGLPFTTPSANPSSALCGGCHSNGPLADVAAADGFILDHSQYNELLASPHDNRFCVECHDPHKPAELSLRTDCIDCHMHAAMADEKAAFTKLGRRHLARGVRCVDCHMPYAAKSAVAESPWKGDVRSHLFAITVKSGAKMFKAEGTLAKGKLTPAFACLGCHVEVANKFLAKGEPKKAEAWALKHAKKIHEH